MISRGTHYSALCHKYTIKTYQFNFPYSWREELQSESGLHLGTCGHFHSAAHREWTRISLRYRWSRNRIRRIWSARTSAVFRNYSNNETVQHMKTAATLYYVTYCALFVSMTDSYLLIHPFLRPGEKLVIKCTRVTITSHFRHPPQVGHPASGANGRRVLGHKSEEKMSRSFSDAPLEGICPILYFHDFRRHATAAAGGESNKFLSFGFQ